MNFKMIDTPAFMQAYIAFLASWALLYLIQRDIPWSKHRHRVTRLSLAAFTSYWLAYWIDLPLGWFSPYFGPLGIGDEVSFMLAMSLVAQSFQDVENLAHWKAAFGRRFEVTFTEDGPKLERFPSLAERSAEAEGKPYLPPAGMTI